MNPLTGAFFTPGGGGMPEGGGGGGGMLAGGPPTPGGGGIFGLADIVTKQINLQRVTSRWRGNVLGRPQWVNSGGQICWSIHNGLLLR